ncbi:MAG: ATP-binding cassette domain-containing protein, partial [Tannerellaceae bacterium]|nr:ATP-binding cassette domain-containing protein [Tannerellaceae bacterium]
MSIIIQHIQYIHTDKEELFRDLSFSLSKGKKAGLTGNNGCGKSTLLQVIAGVLKASAGEIITPTPPYYVPQHFGQYDLLTVGEALQVAEKIRALQAILAGDASTENFNILDDDWGIEEKCLAALAAWDLEHITLHHPLSSLSGGEKTKVFLAGISLHQPSVILMDEPTNHLDASSRSKLYR